MSFDKEKIKSHFNHFSKNYNSLASLQKQVASKLFEIAKPEIAKAQNILDLGCGTGFITQNILNENDFSQKNIFQLDIAYDMLLENNFSQNGFFQNNHNIFNINADIENLPFKENSFDLVLSSLALQWIDDLNLTLKNIKKICYESNSTLIFSIFIDGTLEELKKSAQELNVNLAVNDFIDLNNLKTIVEKNFAYYQIEVQNLAVKYENVFDLIYSIKNIGASYSNKKSSNITLTKTDFLNLNNFYLKNFSNYGKITGSWKIAYIKISI